jgi:hypothetical protein
MSGLTISRWILPPSSRTEYPHCGLPLVWGGRFQRERPKPTPTSTRIATAAYPRSRSRDQPPPPTICTLSIWSFGKGIGFAGCCKSGTMSVEAPPTKRVTFGYFMIDLSNQIMTGSINENAQPLSSPAYFAACLLSAGRARLEATYRALFRNGCAHMLYLAPFSPTRFFNSALPVVTTAGASSSRELVGG